MDFRVILNKIKQTGRSNKAERVFLQSSILETLTHSPEYVESYGGVTMVKFLNTPIGKIVNQSSEDINIEGFGYFKDLFDPIFSHQVLRKLNLKKPENKVLEIEASPEKNKVVKNLSKDSGGDKKYTGIAFEYAAILSLKYQLDNIKVNSTLNDRALGLESNYHKFSEQEKYEYEKAASLALAEILPNYNQQDWQNLGKFEIHSMEDYHGVEGDVRDFVLINTDIEIGFSCKNNKDSAKHSRLSIRTNFYSDWGIRKIGCSDGFKEKMKQIFSPLIKFNEENGNPTWDNYDPTGVKKGKECYEAIILALQEEFTNNPLNAQEMKQLALYLMGYKSNYKILKKKNSVVITYMNSENNLPQCPEVKFPTKIENMTLGRMENGFVNTLIMNCDNGWIFEFRIHNDEREVRKPLKFDISIKEYSPSIVRKEIYYNKVE